MKRIISIAPQEVINDILPAGTTRLYELPVPLGVNVEVDLDVRVINPVTSAAVWIRYPGCDLAPPSFGSAPFGTGIGVVNASTMQRIRVVTDRQGRVAVSAYTSGTVVMASLSSIVGEVCLPGKVLMSSVKVSHGGRIDAICNLGKGIIIVGTRKNSSESEQGKIYRSADYGKTWTFIAKLASAGITCIASDTSCGIAYAVSHNSELWRSDDGGMTWNGLGIVSSNRERPGLALTYGITVSERGSLLLLDSAGYAFRSTDHGASFSSVFVDQDGLYRLQRVEDGIIANGWGGRVYKSCDDGLSWRETAKLSSGPLYAIEYVGRGVVLIGTAAGKIFISENNGESWVHHQTLQGEADDFALIDQNNVLYSTYTGMRQVYHSANSGKEFMPIGQTKTEQGDWIDHAVQMQTPSGPAAICGTAYGNIVEVRIIQE